MAIRPVLVEGVFLGLAAGSIWVAPYIGGGSFVAVLFVAACLTFSARHAAGSHFLRTALVGLIAWPISCLWQAVHMHAPSAYAAAYQLAVLLACSQAAALIAKVLGTRKGA